MKPPAITCWLILLVTLPAQASDRWQFTERVEVPAVSGDGVFHHLEGAGRKHIAVSDGSIGITWEDNSPGSPQVFVAIKPAGIEPFSNALQLSRGQEAWEPAIAGLGEQTFLVAWEQDERIHAAIVQANKVLTEAQISNEPSGHTSVDAYQGKAVISWREQRASGWFIQVAAVDSNDLNGLQAVPVETNAVAKPVQMPSVSMGPAGVGIAWEDRREGHTRMLYSHSEDGRQFLAPDSLNEFYSGRTEYDKGNGSTRVSIARFGDDEVISAWMDKRRSAGYGIFASLGSEGGASYGPNEKVHGPLGDRDPHYNPSTAGNENGDFAVAWDDYRLGDADIWISYYDDFDEWGEDLGPAIAGGAGEQTHPSITLDDNGDLHMVWMEKQDLFAPSRLWYSHGKRQAD